jgi:hypothetical protein
MILQEFRFTNYCLQGTFKFVRYFGCYCRLHYKSKCNEWSIRHCILYMHHGGWVDRIAIWLVSVPSGVMDDDCVLRSIQLHIFLSLYLSLMFMFSECFIISVPSLKTWAQLAQNTNQSQTCSVSIHLSTCQHRPTLTYNSQCLLKRLIHLKEWYGSRMKSSTVQQMSARC